MAYHIRTKAWLMIRVIRQYCGVFIDENDGQGPCGGMDMTRLLVLALILCASPVMAQTDDDEPVRLKAMIAAIVVTYAADAITTHVALQNPKIYESILTQNAWANDAILASLTMGEIALLTRARNRKVARVCGFIVAGVHGYIAYRNLQVIRRAR